MPVSRNPFKLPDDLTDQKQAVLGVELNDLRSVALSFMSWDGQYSNCNEVFVRDVPGHVAQFLKERRPS